MAANRFFPFLSSPFHCRTAATKHLDESLSMRSHHQFDGRSDQIFHFHFHGSGDSIGLLPPRTMKSIIVSVADQIIRRRRVNEANDAQFIVQESIMGYRMKGEKRVEKIRVVRCL